MIYCDSPLDGASPIKNIHHKGLHYAVVDEDADLPKGFRETPDKKKEAKPIKAVKAVKAVK